MWLFTKYGFFSAVCAAQSKRGGDVDPNTIMVRARVRAHLEALKARFPRLKAAKILTDAGTDYRYRIIVPKEAWAEVAAALAQEIDYGNFKSACKRDHEYHDALMRVWTVVRGLQR